MKWPANKFSMSHGATDTKLILRHPFLTRVTHWSWAICLFFLLLSGLQIFNAHPVLYIGDQSGFDFSNQILEIGANYKTGTGFIDLFGIRLDTTGFLGISKTNGFDSARAFPAWLTLPSGQDLAGGRRVHFFFAWSFVFTLLIWLVSGLVNGHIRKDLIPGGQDLRSLKADFLNHIKLKFHHTAQYVSIQKLTYGIILFVAFPIIILSGLAMSPGFNAIFPGITEIFGGRQTARTVHFLFMLILSGFFIIHMIMILAAGPINLVRSIVTGRYRIEASPKSTGGSSDE